MEVYGHLLAPSTDNTSSKRLHGFQNWSAEQIICSGNACNFHFGSFHLRSLIKLRKLLFSVVLLSPDMLNATEIVPKEGHNSSISISLDVICPVLGFCVTQTLQPIQGH
jgi:hypothetical protein